MFIEPGNIDRKNPFETANSMVLGILSSIKNQNCMHADCYQECLENIKILPEYR